MSNNNDFIKSFENATKEIISRVAINMNTACLLVERQAKINCPVDQGTLRASMFSQVKLIDGELIKGIVGNSSEYAPYVHQGTGLYAVNGDGRKTPWCYRVESGKYKGYHWTKGQKPQPFLEQSKQSNLSKISRILAGV